MLLVCLLGASEMVRDSTDRRLQLLSRAITMTIVPLLGVFSFIVVKRILEVF